MICNLMNESMLMNHTSDCVKCVCMWVSMKVGHTQPGQTSHCSSSASCWKTNCLIQRNNLEPVNMHHSDDSVLKCSFTALNVKVWLHGGAAEIWTQDFLFTWQALLPAKPQRLIPVQQPLSKGSFIKLMKLLTTKMHLSLTNDYFQYLLNIVSVSKTSSCPHPRANKTDNWKNDFTRNVSAALQLWSGFAPPSGDPHWLRLESGPAVLSTAGVARL